MEEGSVTVLDVRTRGEYEGDSGYPCDPRQGHIPGAVNVELDELYGVGDAAALLEERGVDVRRPIVAYCHSGSRSALAAEILRAAGYDARNYPGSWHEWSRRSE